MPKAVAVPGKIRPFIFHGVDLDWEDRGDEAIGECPFCARNKFYVNIEEGLYNCKVCGEKGNAYTFLRKMWDRLFEATKDYDSLAADRRLLFPETLVFWEICKDGDTWVVPGYNPAKEITQLYRYIKDRTSGKMKLLPTPDLNHGMHGVNLFDRSKPTVYVCEGPWDAIALWETLRITKKTDEGFVYTANPDSSLLNSCSVVATPGCSTFNDGWANIFSGKHVCLMFDSDHPKEAPPKSGKFTQPGYDGMKRIAGVLAFAEKPPDSIQFLKWGDKGYDPILASGFDVRDWLSGKGGETPQGRVQHVKTLLDRIAPIPADWIAGRRKSVSKKGGVEVDCLECSDWKTLVNSWRKAMKWTEGLDRALSVMLACVASTKALGDQLWVKIIGPASCGKSTLCEALSVNRKYVLARSTIRGFHSGYNDGSDEDYSLIAKLYDKTLVTKDGDTLLQAPNLKQILSEARDLFDTTSRSDYRHGRGRSYEGVRMTWILCGTSSLRSIDSSELGERFVDCVIMEGIDDELENEILLRVANRADRIMSHVADGKLETQHDPELVKAMQLTGGYISWLRANAAEKMKRIQVTDGARDKCIQLGKFVAYFRARPSEMQNETAEREFAARLVVQMVRLAKCLALVLNKATVDSEVMRRVTCCALDTARGETLKLAKYLYKAGAEGKSRSAIAAYMDYTERDVLTMLRFLHEIGVIRSFWIGAGKGVKGNQRWSLSPKIIKLYESVMGSGSEEERAAKESRIEAAGTH